MVSQKTGETYTHWKLIVSALFVAAVWLALVPTTQTWEGGAGPGSNCGIPMLNAGESAVSADGCTYANRVRLQQALMTGALGIVIQGAFTLLLRIREPGRKGLANADAD